MWGGGNRLTLYSFLQHGEPVGDLGLQLVDLERPADRRATDELRRVAVCNRNLTHLFINACRETMHLIFLGWITAATISPVKTLQEIQNTAVRDVKCL